MVMILDIFRQIFGSHMLCVSAKNQLVYTKLHTDADILVLLVEECNIFSVPDL